MAGLLIGLIGLIGVAGFIGLLIASHRFPADASGLRGLALIWLLGAGGLKLLIRYSRD